jgi:hypothetical protein
MNTLKVMGDSGHTKVKWDPDALRVHDSEALAAVREAERIFNEVRSRGGSAFTIDPVTHQTTKIDEFDPDAEETIVAFP